MTGGAVRGEYLLTGTDVTGESGGGDDKGGGGGGEGGLGRGREGGGEIWMFDV